jgi:hypothetical protein
MEMTSYSNDLQVRWIVACLSPSDIAPHPNFRTDRVDDAELLALIVRMQWQEYESYRELNEDEKIPVRSRRILDAARRALDSETIHEGLRELIRVASDENLSLGERGAAALLAANADSELDVPDAHIALLDHLASLMVASAGSFEDSRKLASAILLQQCAFRAFEAGRTDTSRQYAGQVLSALARIGSDWEEFPVSRGVSWSSQVSQTRLAELIIGNAKSLLAGSADIRDDSWVEIVKAPYPAASTRSVRDAFSGLAATIEEVFKDNFASTKRARRLMQRDNVLRPLYSSLLHAELSGDVSDASRMRNVVGNILAVRSALDESLTATRLEALRLLRQADSTDHLQRLLTKMRAHGPLEAIREAAEKVVDARREQDYVTSSDLALIDQAADLLSPAYTNDAIELAFRYARQPYDGRLKRLHSALWKQIETALRSVNLLISGNSDVDFSYIVRAVVDLVADSEAVGDQFVVSALAALSPNVRLDAVPENDKDAWVALAGLGSEPASALAVDRLRIYLAAGQVPPRQISANLASHEFVVALINGWLGDAGPEDLDKASDIVSRTLQTVQSEASRGAYTVYSWSPFSLAAILITRFSRFELWPILIDVLSDPNVANDGKYDVIRLLAERVPTRDVAASLRDHLPEGRIPEFTEQGNSLFSVPLGQLNATRRSFHLAYDLERPSSLQESILGDIGARDASIRAESATSCLFSVIADSRLEWPVVLLLQLSYDQAPVVQGNAARALAYLSALVNVSFLESICQRVETLLSAPGTSGVMSVLRGLYEAAESSSIPSAVLRFKESLTVVAREHPSRAVRDAAREVLGLFAES